MNCYRYHSLTAMKGGDKPRHYERTSVYKVAAGFIPAFFCNSTERSDTILRHLSASGGFDLPAMP